MAKVKVPVAHIEKAPEEERQETAAAQPKAETADAQPKAAPRAAQPKAASAPQPKTKVTVAQPKAKVASEEAPEPEQPKQAPQAAASPTDVPGKGPLAWLAKTFPGHRFAVLGGLCGLVVALLFFVIGFWKTLFVCLLTFVGVALGQYLDGDPKIVNMIRRLLVEGRGGNEG